LRNVEIRNLHIPTRLGILARNKPGAGGFSYAAFLRYDGNYERHDISFLAFTAESLISVKQDSPKDGKPYCPVDRKPETSENRKPD
jgi:hypothetical protein